MSSAKEGLQMPNLLVPIIHMSALRMVCIHANLFDCTNRGRMDLVYVSKVY
jgi:hypothetical protein